jgi:colicin import membrane protein
MNKSNKKNIVIAFKVFIIHIIIIFILDINLSAIIKNDRSNFNEKNNAQFLNLKSISMEELQNKRRAIEIEKKRLQDLKRKRLAEQKRKKKLAEEKKKKLAEEKKKKLAEEKKKKLAEEKKKKLAEEKKKKLDEQKRKKKLAEEKKKKELEDLKNDEIEKLAKYELEKLERELLEIERIETLIKNQNIRNAQLTDAEKKYILTIKAKIENNWLVPHDSRYDKICTVIVNQLPSGKVTNVKVHGCKGDSLYIDSLINAVWKSSPLPIAPDIEVFQENIVLQFVGPQ